MGLGVAPEMLEDIRLLYGLADSTVNTGKGPLSDLKNKCTKMPPQGDSSVIEVLRDLEHLRTHSRAIVLSLNYKRYSLWKKTITLS